MRELYSAPTVTLATLGTSDWEDTVLDGSPEVHVAALTVIDESSGGDLLVRFGAAGDGIPIRAIGMWFFAPMCPLFIYAGAKLQVKGTAGQAYRIVYQTFAQ